MLNSPIQKTDKYISAFRDLLNERLLSSAGSVRELLRLNKDEDWYFITIAMDVFQDAGDAISNFQRFGTSGPSKYEDAGERYLRLYGLLSATHTQQEAIYELHKRMNVPEPRLLRDKINDLQIRNLRHKLASHSTNYRLEEEDETHAYAPIKIQLKDFVIGVMSYSNSEYTTVDLNDALDKHFEVLLDGLDALYEKTFRTIFKGQSSKLAQYEERLADLRVVKDGGMVIRSIDGENHVIATFTESDMRL